MSTILLGVDDSDRAHDAVAFAALLAPLTEAPIVVANVYPYEALPARERVA